MKWRRKGKTDKEGEIGRNKWVDEGRLKKIRKYDLKRGVEKRGNRAKNKNKRGVVVRKEEEKKRKGKRKKKEEEKNREKINKRKRGEIRNETTSKLCC